MSNQKKNNNKQPKNNNTNQQQPSNKNKNNRNQQQPSNNNQPNNQQTTNNQPNNNQPEQNPYKRGCNQARRNLDKGCKFATANHAAKYAKKTYLKNKDRKWFGLALTNDAKQFVKGYSNTMAQSQNDSNHSSQKNNAFWKEVYEQADPLSIQTTPPSIQKTPPSIQTASSSIQTGGGRRCSAFTCEGKRCKRRTRLGTRCSSHC